MLPKCRLQFIQTPRFLVYFGEGVPQHRCSIIVSISIIFNSQTRQFCITPSGMIDGERICHSVHSQKVWCVARGVLPHKRFARRNWRYCSEQLVSAAALFPSPFILINGLQRSPTNYWTPTPNGINFNEFSRWGDNLPRETSERGVTICRVNRNESHTQRAASSARCRGSGSTHNK